MRISDWSSDVCSSDLDRGGAGRGAGCAQELQGGCRSRYRCTLEGSPWRRGTMVRHARPRDQAARRCPVSTLRRFLRKDRKSVGSVKRVSVRVVSGGHSLIKKKTQNRIIRNYTS